MVEKLEITGKSINECIEEGVKKLGIDLSDEEHEVVEEGSKGFLGIGARPFKVLVWSKSQAEKEEKEEKKAEKKEVKAAVKAKKKAEKEAVKAEKKTEKVESVKSEVASNELEDTVKEEAHSERADITDEDKDKILKTACDFLNDVFAKMNMQVMIHAYFLDNKQIRVDLEGEEMGTIIGKRGQTLDSLQYLTNLVVNKGEYPYMNVTIDTEGYRDRRKETLEKLAFNLAKKAKHNRRNVTLEPMNPYERRIIHAALQNDRYVTTFSEGAEPYRYVVIALKNGYPTRRRSYFRTEGSYHKEYDNYSGTKYADRENYESTSITDTEE